MPLYIFFCETCNKEFTKLLHMDELDKSPVKCPECGNEKVHRLVAAFTAVTAKKS